MFLYFASLDLILDMSLKDYISASLSYRFFNITCHFHCTDNNPTVFLLIVTVYTKYGYAMVDLDKYQEEL